MISLYTACPCWSMVNTLSPTLTSFIGNLDPSCVRTKESDGKHFSKAKSETRIMKVCTTNLISIYKGSSHHIEIRRPKKYRKTGNNCLNIVS